MSSSSSEEIPRKRFFRHRKPPSTSTPTARRDPLSSTSVSEISTGSSGNIKKGEKKKQKRKTKQKDKRDLKREGVQPSVRKQISEEWETVNESLQRTPIKESVVESKNTIVLLDDAGCVRNTQQVREISESNIFDLRSPEKTQKALNFIQDHELSPIFPTGIRTKRRRGYSRRIISEDEEEVLTSRRKPPVRTEKEATDETSRESSIRKEFESRNDAIFEEAGSSKDTQQVSQISEPNYLFEDLPSPKRTESSELDVPFVDLTSPEKIRRATHFIQDRLESPIRGSGIRRLSESPKRITVGEDKVALPQFSDDEEADSSFVLSKVHKTYPAIKRPKYRPYNRDVDVYGNMYFPNDGANLLWDKFVSENYENVKQYLAPANDKNPPKRKTLREVLHPTSSNENAKMQQPTLREKYGKDMNVAMGVWDKSTGKWKTKIMYISSESDEGFDKIIEERMRRNKLQVKKRNRKRKTEDVYDLSSSSPSDEYESKRFKTVTTDPDHHQSASKEKRAFNSEHGIPLPSISKDTEKFDQSIFSSKRVKRERRVGNRKKTEKNKLSEIKKKPIITSIESWNEK